MEVAGLIFGVIPIATEIVNIVEYVQTALSFDDERTRLLSEVYATVCLLDRLKESAQKDDSGLGMTKSFLAAKAGSDQYQLVLQLQAVLEKVKKKLKGEHTASGSVQKWMKKVREKGHETGIMWPLKKGEVQEYVEQIARMREAVVAAMVGDTAFMTQRIQRDMLEHFEQSEHDKKRELVLSKLNAPGITDGLQEDTRFRRASGTNEWFLEASEFKQWTETPGAVFWLQGKIGCGKSTMCRTIIRRLHKQKENGMAVIHIFSTNFDKRADPVETMLRSIIKQALEQLDDIPDEILNLEDELQDDSEDTYSILSNACKAILDKFKQSFVVIDGLVTQAHDGGAVWLSGIYWPLSNFNVLVASATQQSSWDLLSRPETSVIDLDDRAEIQEDINSFISASLESDKDLSRWPADIKEEIKQGLMMRACGTFSLVANSINELKKHRVPEQLWQALHKLPKDTNESYESMLKNMVQDNPCAEYAYGTLQWLCFSQRPLTTAELRDLIAIDESKGFDRNRRLRDPGDIVDCCPNIVEMYSVNVDELQDEFNDTERNHIRDTAIEPTPFSKVNFIRFSQPHLREFLTSDQTAKSIGTEESSAQALLARFCLLYLREMRTLQPLSDWPAAVYAATHWHEHVRAVPRSELRQQAALLNLMWEVFSDKDLREHIRSIAQEEQPVVSRICHFSEKGIFHLVERCLPVNANTESGRSRLNEALCGAARNKRKRIAKLLLTNGAEANMKTLEAALTGRNAELFQLLLQRTHLNDAENGELVRLSIERKVRSVFLPLLERVNDVNMVVDTDNGLTLLHVAALNRRPWMAQNLLERGAKADLLDKQSRTALDIAKENGAEKILEIIHSQGES